ncbi:unnamed protein product [Strongylus vulgaris]|uniref:Uncharacterized protein n=1 Tax=Strongylus vulgaris TaxID=40348 RepID=A0A3P7J671_STRVU|nr:unnamed protein product [Strongylus vulgaris]
MRITALWRVFRGVSKFLVRKLHHAYELYPIFALTGVWFIMFCYVIYYSFEKMEVWLDRSKTTAPWDWERIRDNYWKKPTLAFDREGKTTAPWDWERIRDNYWKKPTLAFDREGVSHRRLGIMEQLQDEMLIAAKERGTR